MATGTAGKAARRYPTHQTHHLAIEITKDNFASRKMGTLPAGAAIVRAGAVVSEAFNAGTTNTFQIGSTSGGSEIVSSAVSLAAAAIPAGTIVFAAAKPAVDTDIYFTSGITGTAPTTGKATIFLEYFVPDGNP